MNVQYYTDPWPHVVIDDFLPNYIFSSLVDIKEEVLNILDHYTKLKTQKRYYINCFSGDTIVSKDLKDGDQTEEIKKLLKDVGLYDIINQYNLFVEDNNDLLEIYDILSDKEEYNFFKSGVQIQDPGFEYEIHPEAPGKLMSLITFITPEDNYGTWLYESDTQDYYQPSKKIEWKQNRAFIFCGKESTWHAFTAKTDEEQRFTLATFFHRT